MNTLSSPKTSEQPVSISRPGVQPPKHLSYSALSDYDFCPMSYALKRIDRAARTSGLSMFVGQVVHEIMEKIPADDDTGESLIEDVSKVFLALPDNIDPDETDGKKRDRVPLEDREKFESEVSKSLAMFNEWEMTNPKRASLRGVELKIDGVISDFYLIGQIDALDVDEDGSIVLSDYKSGKVPSPAVAATEFGPNGASPAIYHAQATRQCVIYALLAKTKGLRVDKVRMLYPRTQTIIEVDLRTPRGEMLMKEAENFVSYQGMKLGQSYATGTFVARPTKGRCGSCSVRESCEARYIEPEVED